MMAGLLDQYSNVGNTQAFAVLLRMAEWVQLNVGRLLQHGGGQVAWQQVLNTEWGGMNEVLYNLYGVTGNSSHLEAGRYFNHWQWTAPLAVGLDDLDGSHGNTYGRFARAWHAHASIRTHNMLRGLSPSQVITPTRTFPRSLAAHGAMNSLRITRSTTSQATSFAS